MLPGALSPRHSRGSSPGAFLLLFQHLKKKITYIKQTPFHTIRKQAFIFSLTKKSVAGFGTQPQVSQRLFCFFFLRLKKEDIHLKPLTPGKVARSIVTERAFINAWQANAGRPYLTTDDLSPRMGVLRSPAHLVETSVLDCPNRQP